MPSGRSKPPSAKVRPLKGGRLEPYVGKRNFAVTPEPLASAPSTGGDLFVIQKHAATRLHYDLRLEMGGVLRSWAVTKGPSLDPAEKRLAVAVEDHPVSYGSFEGTIPGGQYGAGSVIIWDTGTWAPMGDLETGLRTGNLKFRLSGHKLKGGFALVRLRGQDKNWLLIKENDSYAEPGSGDAIAARVPASVISGLTVEEMGKQRAAAARARPKRPRKVAVPDPATLTGARMAELGDPPAPELATLATKPPSGAGWVHEIKYDGYRTMARIDHGAVRLITRNGYDWTDKYRPVADALAALPCQTAILDGEVCVQGADGKTSFSALQDALADGETAQLVYWVFDLIHLNGYDLTQVRLVDRKRVLASLVQSVAADDSFIHYSEHVVGDGAAFLDQALKLGLEGIVSKRADAPYEPQRSRSWVKVKDTADHEFAVVGYTESPDSGPFGALLVAQSSADGLTYAGKVGTGFNGKVAADLFKRLQPLVRKEPVFTLRGEDIPKKVRWVEPKLFVTVTFANRTPKGHLRAPRFKSLRPAADVAAPRPVIAGSRPPRVVSDADLASVWITNPDRRMFGDGGPTKLDIAVYYAKVSDWMLPGLTERPLTVIRCPTGKPQDCFYQRHAMTGMPKDIRTIPLPEEGKKEKADFLYLSDAKGLLALAQFGVVEFHPWGCHIDKPERPDRMVLDLDPDPGLDWRVVTDAAEAVRAFLDTLGLAAYPRTTGGKGIHIVTPLERHATWAEFKDFSQAIVVALAERQPRRFTASLSKAARAGKIFIDYLRNGRSATAVGSYSLRSRPGAPVATPLTWDELAALDDPRAADWRSVPARLDALHDDPWAGIDGAAVRLPLAKLLGKRAPG